METIFEILKMNPSLSIILGFASAVILAIVFRDLIKSFVKKKYDLYEKEDLQEAISSAKKGKTENEIISKIANK